MKLKSVVFSIGGSTIFTENGVDIEFLKKLKEVVYTLVSKGYTVGIVVGGGKYAREYINFAKKLGLSEVCQHTIGMLITQVNAKLLSLFLGVQNIYTDYLEILSRVGKEQVFIMGGVIPGYTTDTDAANLALTLNSKILINVTSVDGVYDKDPKKYPDAKLIRKLSYDDLLKIFGSNKITPGMNFVFDPLATLICKQYGIKIIIINKTRIEEIIDYLEKGKEIYGTIIE